MKRIFLSMCVLATMAVNSCVASEACNRQPVHPSRVQTISRDMLINGVPVAVYAVDFDASPDDVSNAFRAYWTQAHVPARGWRDASGLLLSALDGNCHYVLTLPPQSNGASAKGVMSVMRLDGGARHRIDSRRVPLPDGARPLGDVESRDGQQTGRTWLISTDGDTQDAARRYARQLEAAGWKVVAQAPALTFDGTQRALGDMLAMQRGSDRIDAMFSRRSGSTEAVIHATTDR